MIEGRGEEERLQPGADLVTKRMRPGCTTPGVRSAVKSGPLFVTSTSSSAISRERSAWGLGPGEAAPSDVVGLEPASVGHVHEGGGHALVEEEPQRHGRFGGRPRRGVARA